MVGAESLFAAMAEFIFADDYCLDEGRTRRFYEAFLKGLVHKHNNLMGVIQGFSSLILYDEGISDEVRENAQQMQDSAKTATHLHRDVLLAAGCSPCERSAVSLDELMNYWKQKAEEVCEESGVTLQFSTRDELPAVTGEGAKLTEIFTHLVRNAAEAAAEAASGAVAVDLFPPGEASPGNNVDLFIRNTSEPMDEEALRQALAPFESSKGSDHFGIGLTVAAVLAGQMGMRLGLNHADGTTTAWLAMPASS